MISIELVKENWKLMKPTEKIRVKVNRLVGSFSLEPTHALETNKSQCFHGESLLDSP